MTAGRRCALPGCYVMIDPPTDGRPQRKYCTSAHRAIARQQRREGTQRSASAPPLPVPGKPAAPARRPVALTRELPLPPLAEALESSRGRQATVPTRRTRTLAMLGSAGLLITGTTLSLADTPHGNDATTATPWQAQDPETEQNWASEARVSLSSIERQLADVQAAARDWNSLPAEERTGEVPEGILHLARRKVLLEQQRSTLIERLADYDRYDRARQNLATDERTVAEMDRMLSAAPAHSQASPTEADDNRRLRAQREARARVLTEQRGEVARLHGDIRQAMAAPLPSGDQATRAITGTARELVRDPARRRAAREARAPQIPRTPDQAGRLPGDILAAPSPEPSRSGPPVLTVPGVTAPGVTAPGVTAPGVTAPGLTAPGSPGARARRAGPDVLAEPPAAGGLLDRVGGGRGRNGPAGRGPLGPGLLPVDPGVGLVEPGIGLVEPVESSVSGRKASRITNVAYDKVAPTPAAVGGPVGEVTGPLAAPAAATPSRSAPSLPDLITSAAGGYDPVTATRAGLAARVANDAISSLPADENTKNLARLAVGGEILRQSAAENGRYRASGGAEDPERIADTVRDMAKLKSAVEADKAAIESLQRDWRMPRDAAKVVVGAARLEQLKPADRERAKRLIRDYAKAKITADALSGRYRSNRQVESAIRDQLRSAARGSVEDRFRASARKSIEKSLRSSARKSIEDRFRASARKSIEKSLRSSARKSIEDRFRASARKSIEKSLRSSARRSIEKSLRSSARRSIEKSMRSSARRSIEKSIRKSLSKHFER